MARKGRKRKAQPVLPAVTVAQATALASGKTWAGSLEAELEKLGPVPPRAVEREIRAGFGRQRVGKAFREAAAYMPEVALAMLGARPRLNLRQCPTVIRMLALDHPAYADECRARQDWIERRNALLEQDRRWRLRGEWDMGDITTRDPKTGIEVSLLGADRGTAQRRQQEGGVYATTAPNSDRRSQPVTVVRASDTLGRLLRSRTINTRELRVARRFAADFSAALFDRYPTMKLERVAGGSSDDGARAVAEARQKIGAALALLGGQGSDQGDLMWRVAGEGLSLADWVVLRRMSVARRLNPQIATGLLISALQRLHPFYFPEAESAVGDVPLGGAVGDVGDVGDEDPCQYRSGRAGHDAPPFEERLERWREDERAREKAS